MQGKILDYRGEECPAPLIKAARAIAGMGEGSRIIILTDVEDCVKLLRETLEAFGINNIVIEKKDSYWAIKAIVNK